MSSKTFPTLATESALHARGARFIIGVDEVGRGSIAGPVAVGMTLLDFERDNLQNWPEPLRDSKLMSAKAREAIFDSLASWIGDHEIGFASNSEIDELGISKALQIAAARALSALLESNNLRQLISTKGAIVLLDGSYNWLGSSSAGLEVNTQVKADANCVSVAAASVLAKVTRDQLMQDLANEYPEYDLESNKGYASKSHIAALQSFGASDIHRKTWLANILGKGGID